VRARLGLVALAIVAARGHVEGLLRVAAHLNPRVRFLATGRASRPAVTYATLEEFVGAQAPYITPRRPWFNYWSNALGFHDEEFVEPKPPGRLRVLAVGDSFTFGPVPYPQSVMTLTEDGLRAACGGRAVDLLNMGVMGAGSPEYRSLAELGVSRYSPDVVLVNLFLGNDPPDLHRHVHDRSPVERLLRRSYAWTLVKNVRRTRGGLREARLPARVGAAPAEAPVSRGGERVEGSADLAADDPALVGPLLSDEAYQEVLASDLGRFYRPDEPQDLRTAWRALLGDLEALASAASRTGSRLALTFLPSVLQVDAALRAEMVSRMSTTVRYRGLSGAQIDPGLPNGVLEEFARARGIPRVDLTPVFVAAHAAGAEPLYKRNDIHWTPRGNRIAAEALVAFLAPLVCAHGS
jgi:hypothetical protein